MILSEEDFIKIRELICSFCFENCEFMKNSDTYMTCSLKSKKNEIAHQCKVWEFLKYIVKGMDKDKK